MTQKLIVNCTTGERSIVDYTAEEEAAATAAGEAQLAEMEAEKVAEEKRVADKASGDAKLKALGLTDDEIAAR